MRISSICWSWSSTKGFIEVKVVPTVRLTDIYRQAEGSSIIELAHDIKKGYLPANVTMKQPDRSFIKCSTAQIPQVIEKIALNAKSKGYSARDIQVLAPMYRGPAGIDRLNVLFKRYLILTRMALGRNLHLGM